MIFSSGHRRHNYFGLLVIHPKTIIHFGEWLSLDVSQVSNSDSDPAIPRYSSGYSNKACSHNTLGKPKNRLSENNFIHIFKNLIETLNLIESVSEGFPTYSCISSNSPRNT